MGLLNHLRLSIIFTTNMADQDVKESHEKTVNLETFGGGTKINYFNVLMDIPVNGRN